MHPGELKKKSKYLSLILRHSPDKVHITLDANGWVNVDTLLNAVNLHGSQLTRSELEYIVAHNDKKRFAFSEDGQRIRANQGHSVDVSLDHEVKKPPNVLYHGTPTKFVDSILKHGLSKMARHDVHLYSSKTVPLSVAARRGKPALIVVDAAAMVADGYQFAVTPNEVWLTERVPPQYLKVSYNE